MARAVNSSGVSVTRSARPAERRRLPQTRLAKQRPDEIVIVNRTVAKAEVDARVRHAAKLLEMEHLLDRYPKQLSGGQAQRAFGKAHAA